MQVGLESHKALNCQAYAKDKCQYPLSACSSARISYDLAQITMVHIFILFSYKVIVFLWIHYLSHEEILSCVAVLDSVSVLFLPSICLEKSCSFG